MSKLHEIIEAYERKCIQTANTILKTIQYTKYIDMIIYNKHKLLYFDIKHISNVVNRHFYNWGKKIDCYVEPDYEKNVAHLRLCAKSCDERETPNIPVLILLACQKSPHSPVWKFMNSPIYDRNLFRIIDKLSGKSLSLS